jgi:sec-independent protein translocase protein TatA
MFSGWDRPSHWVVIAVIALVLFGYKKLPDAARSVGRSLRIFKTEMKGMTEDDQAREAARSEPKAVTDEATTAESAPDVAPSPLPADDHRAEVPGAGTTEPKGDAASN